MKRVLLVDDEPLFLKSLAEGLSISSSLELCTALNGKEAVEILASRRIDLLVTDLRMPEMDGFELLAHVSTRFPQLPVMVITAFATNSIRTRLQQYGHLTCIEKPLDLDDFAARVLEMLNHGDRGYVHGISIPSFLQLLQIERKTCQLEISSAGQCGRLYLREGELFGAELGDLRGEAAALVIIGWDDNAIEIENVCRLRERNVSMDLSFLIMESLRMADERQAASRASKEQEAPSPDLKRPLRLDSRLDSAATAKRPISRGLKGNSIAEASLNGAPAKGGAPASTETAFGLKEAAGEVDVATKVGVGPTAKTLDKEKTMALETYLKSFRDVKGLQASAILNYTGEVLASDSIEQNIDLGLVGATFNDIFRAAHEASRKIGLDACHEMVLKTPKGLVLMQCSGAESKSHVHLLAVMAADGNQALMKMRFDHTLAKIVQEVS